MLWVRYTLATAAAVVVVAVVVLLALGGFRGRSEQVATVDIARPADAVFRWISEPARLKSWVGWMIDVQTLTPQTVGAGARHVWVMEDRNNDNQRMSIEAETKRIEPPRLLETAVHVPAMFSGTVRYELQPLNASHTRLTYRADYRMDHWFAKLLAPIITRSAQQKLEEDLARLKQQAEAE